jgi:hypothetical protein
MSLFLTTIKTTINNKTNNNQIQKRKQNVKRKPNPVEPKYEPCSGVGGGATNEGIAAEKTKLQIQSFVGEACHRTQLK